MRRIGLAVALNAAALIALAPPVCARAAGFDYARRTGLVVVERVGSPYLVIRDAGMKPGDAVSIVDLSRPYTVVAASIGRVFPGACPAARNVMRGGTCYTLVLPPDARLHWGPHIAVAAPPERFVADGAGVRAHLEEGGPPTTFRMCAGKEGLHFTLWRGAPVKGKRVWHCYYGLGFDLEPSCEPGESPDGR